MHPILLYLLLIAILYWFFKYEKFTAKPADLKILKIRIQNPRGVKFLNYKLDRLEFPARGELIISDFEKSQIYIIDATDRICNTKITIEFSNNTRHTYNAPCYCIPDPKVDTLPSKPSLIRIKSKITIDKNLTAFGIIARNGNFIDINGNNSESMDLNPTNIKGFVIPQESQLLRRLADAKIEFYNKDGVVEHVAPIVGPGTILFNY